MPKIGIAARATFLLFLLGSGSAAVPQARPAAPASPPDDPSAADHRRRVQEGERWSRSAPPDARPSAARSSNGIVQLTIDQQVTVPLAKRDGPLSGAAPACPYTVGANPATRTASLIKQFPEIVWHVCVTDMGLKGLWVGPVQRAPSLQGPWTTILHQAGPAEIFVPYHDGNPTHRYYDLRWVSGLDQVRSADAGSNGSLIFLTNEAIPTVVAEIRDRGVAWTCNGAQPGWAPGGTRRGEELAIWGVSDGGNYDNIIEYAFRDDGGITFRTGNTGYNSPPMPFQPHTHTTLWYVDIDLNGASNNSATRVRHEEPSTFDPGHPLQAYDRELAAIVETAGAWTAQFSSMIVNGSTSNAFRHPIGYEFTPMQHGAARHYGSDERWAQGDVFLTRYRATELGWLTNWQVPDAYLTANLNVEPLLGRDLVIWLRTDAHHGPRDEDRSAGDINTGQMTGITLAHWSGFRMEPYNSFNANPLGGPAKCGP
jgi:primary-amine oxidase